MGDLRIGIDARAAVGVTDGIGRYAMELLRAFSARSDAARFIVLKNEKTPLSFALDSRFEEIVVSAERFGAAEQLLLPRLLRGLRLDLFHSLHASLPLGYRGVKVMTVHDIFPVMLPWSFGRGRLMNAAASAYYAMLVKLSQRQAALTIVDSEHTARDLRDHLGADPAKLRRVYLGIDHLRPPVAGVGGANALAREGITLPFILTVTNFKPHKNTAGLLAAFRIIRSKRPDLTLVVVGHDANARRRAARPSSDREVEGVRFPGYVRDELLAQLFVSADAFVFPSLYEGFGFPILEAMAAGTPVITSPVASLPELGGDAVVYIDPNDPANIADAVCRVCGNTGLRTDLRTRGRRQADKFRWKETAEETYRVYEESIEQKGRSPR